MKKPTCETCVYRSDSTGECRRRAPVALEGTIEGETDNWVSVRPGCFCGEHNDFEKWLKEYREEQSTESQGAREEFEKICVCSAFNHPASDECISCGRPRTRKESER